MTVEQLDHAISSLRKELGVPGCKPGFDLYLLLELYLINVKARQDINQVLWAHVDDDIPSPLKVA